MTDEQNLAYLKSLYFRGKQYYEEDFDREKAKRFYFQNMMRERTVDGKPTIDLSHLVNKHNA